MGGFDLNCRASEYLQCHLLSLQMRHVHVLANDPHQVCEFMSSPKFQLLFSQQNSQLLKLNLRLARNFGTVRMTYLLGKFGQHK